MPLVIPLTCLSSGVEGRLLRSAACLSRISGRHPVAAPVTVKCEWKSQGRLRLCASESSFPMELRCRKRSHVLALLIRPVFGAWFPRTLSFFFLLLSILSISILFLFNIEA